MKVDTVAPHRPLAAKLTGSGRAWARHSDAVLGFGVVVGLAAVAVWLGRLVPLVGGPVFGILAGACVAPLLPRLCPAQRCAGLRRGFAFAGKHLLQASIVFFGAGLPLTVVLRVGSQSLPVLVGTLAVAGAGCLLVGRLLRVPGRTRVLIGAGTGICGGSAIAAVAPVIGATQAEITYALGTIFTFNIAAVLLFPPLGHLLGLSQHGFGLWAGSAINDTSSVVAAAASYSAAAGPYAVIVKLTRSLMIVPVCLGLRVYVGRRGGLGGGPRTGGGAWRGFPVFVVLFLAASLAATAGVVPTAWRSGLSIAGAHLTTMALTGLGLGMEIATLRRAGPRPLLLGAALWVAVAAVSLGVQAMSGQW